MNASQGLQRGTTREPSPSSVKGGPKPENQILFTHSVHTDYEK